MLLKQLKQAIERVGGNVSEVTVFPDGSAVATATLPLPKDHWLYADHENVPPMPFRCGTDNRRHTQLCDSVRAAARYAIRCATMNGADMDFDPDALVQNMVVGLLGFYTMDGLSKACPEENPDPIPELFDSDPLDLAVRLANAGRMTDAERALLADLVERAVARTEPT